MGSRMESELRETFEAVADAVTVPPPDISGVLVHARRAARRRRRRQAWVAAVAVAVVAAAVAVPAWALRGPGDGQAVQPVQAPQTSQGNALSRYDDHGNWTWQQSVDKLNPPEVGGRRWLAELPDGEMPKVPRGTGRLFHYQGQAYELPEGVATGASVEPVAGGLLIEDGSVVIKKSGQVNWLPVVLSAKTSADGRMVASGLSMGGLTVLSLPNGKTVNTLESSDSYRVLTWAGRFVVFAQGSRSPDGSGDRRIYAWDPMSGTPPKRLRMVEGNPQKGEGHYLARTFDRDSPAYESQTSACVRAMGVDVSEAVVIAGPCLPVAPMRSQLGPSGRYVASAFASRHNDETSGDARDGVEHVQVTLSVTDTANGNVVLTSPQFETQRTLGEWSFSVVWESAGTVLLSVQARQGGQTTEAIVRCHIPSGQCEKADVNPSYTLG